MKKLLVWLVALLVLIVVFGTIYATVQQAQRRAANSPQIQLAQDTAVGINRGDPPVVHVSGNVDVTASLAAFTIVYDKKGNVVTGSGYIKGKTPKAPITMLTAAKDKPYHAATWQPQKDVRIAAVTVAAKDYYVLSGRSLKEFEKNETKTLELVLIGGIVSVLLLGLMFAVNAVDPQYPI